jgi:hypothetical protein
MVMLRRSLRSVNRLKSERVEQLVPICRLP